MRVNSFHPVSSDFKKKYTSEEKEFLDFVKSECKKYGVKCDLRRTKYVKMTSSMICSGWFDESVPELVVAMNRQDWIEILVHEYSHLTQWVDKEPIWVKSEKSLSKVWDWLDGKNCKNIGSHIDVARELESNNDRRAVKIIKKFNLDVDLDQYIQKSNAYHQFYNWLKVTRKWCKPTNSPYKNQRLVNSMPKTFIKDGSILLPKYEKIFREEKI